MPRHYLRRRWWNVTRTWLLEKRVKVTNDTRYPTRELRKIFTEVHRRIAKYEGCLPQWKSIEVNVVYSRKRHTSGWAYRSGYYTKLCIRRGIISVHSVAYLFAHEMMHLYGYGHNRMGNRGHSAPVDLDDIEQVLGFADIKEREPQKKKRPEGVELQQQRYLRVLELEREWQSKLKRAQNALKKYRRKKRYYERELTKKAALPK
jgi:hypothetical protein